VPTIISHPAVSIALGVRLPWRLVLAGAVCSVLPDLDVLAFAAGIPYRHWLGHRGLTHSLAFALVAAIVGTLLHPILAPRIARITTFLYVFVSIASHGLLDAMTTGGEGVGFFIPFSNERYFLPWRPIRVSPIAPARFAERALPVLLSELLWVWLPALAIAIVVAATRLALLRRPSLGPSAQRHSEES
jgi:inner membrane protein